MAFYISELHLDAQDEWLATHVELALPIKELDEHHQDLIGIFDIHQYDPTYRSLVLTINGEWFKLKNRPITVLDRWLVEVGHLCSYTIYNRFMCSKVQSSKTQSRIKIPYVQGHVCWIDHHLKGTERRHFIQLTNCQKLTIDAQELSKTNRASLKFAIPLNPQLPSFIVNGQITSHRLYNYYGVIADIQNKSHTACRRKMRALACSDDFCWQPGYVYNQALAPLKRYFKSLTWLTVEDYLMIEHYHLLSDLFLGYQHHPCFAQLEDILVSAKLDPKILVESYKIYRDGEE